MADQIQSFIEDFAVALREQNAAIFAGAGLSIPAGVVDWKGLLRDVAREIGLDVEKETDLVSIAQYHSNRFRGRAKINQALINEFASRASLTENHKILASLPIRTYWTTNYDTLIEQSLTNAGKTPDVKISHENLATTVPYHDAVVYKMHGDVSQPHKAVITRDDYEQYMNTRSLFSTALRGDLVSKTFLFLGFSFNDPNLAFIFGRVRTLLGENVRRHYCLLRKVRRSDFKTQSQFHYARARLELQVEDLARYGIVAILVREYTDYTKVLRRLAERYRRSWVFISGSAADYDPWTKKEAEKLIFEISRQLTENKFGVISGAGLGVGTQVNNGVLEQLHRENSQVMDGRLVIRPFPQGITNAADRRHRWTAYRKQIIDKAGIAVFLFGNKANDAGDVVLADGVQEEFELSVEKKLAIVPVGCTGSVAEQLHTKVAKRLSRYLPKRGYKELLADLGEKQSAATVAKRVLRIVIKLRDAG
jgi:hypothetical protein